MKGEARPGERGVTARAAAMLTLVLLAAAPGVGAGNRRVNGASNLGRGARLDGGLGRRARPTSPTGVSAPYAIYSVEGFGVARGKGIDDGLDWTSVLESASTWTPQSWSSLPTVDRFTRAPSGSRAPTRASGVGNLNAISSLSAPRGGAPLPALVQAGPGTSHREDRPGRRERRLHGVAERALLYLNAGFGTVSHLHGEHQRALVSPSARRAPSSRGRRRSPSSCRPACTSRTPGPNDGGNHGFGWSTGPRVGRCSPRSPTRPSLAGQRGRLQARRLLRHGALHRSRRPGKTGSRELESLSPGRPDDLRGRRRRPRR